MMRQWTAVVALSVALTGCASAPDTASSGGVENTLKSALFGTPAAGPAPGTRFSGADLLICPEITVRHGTGVHAIGSANAMRAQASIGTTARECALEGQTFSIKAGVEGRLVAGASGSGGIRTTLPLRIAVVDAGPTPKTIWTRAYQVPVTLPAGQPSVQFTHVEPAISFPVPDAAALDRYVIYVGFDTQSGRRER